MTPEELARRITDQFSEHGERGSVWAALGVVLETDRYLNLGYSPRHLPSVVGSPQRRLADRMGRGVRARMDDPSADRLLDVGCGRGGPTGHFADELGFSVTGIDLVPRNARLAAARTAASPTVEGIVIGDALRLPFRSGRFDACVSVDAAPYLPDRDRWFRELARVVADGGTAAVSDLVLATPPGTAPEPTAVDSFLDAWDMAGLADPSFYADRLRDAGWEPLGVDDITDGSVARLTKWSRLYLAIAGTPAYGAVRELFGRRGIDLEPLTDRVRRTHPVLPRLRHVIVYGRRTG